MFVVIAIKVETIIKVVNDSNIGVVTAIKETVQIGAIEESIAVGVDY